MRRRECVKGSIFHQFKINLGFNQVSFKGFTMPLVYDMRSGRDVMNHLRKSLSAKCPLLVGQSLKFLQEKNGKDTFLGNFGNEKINFSILALLLEQYFQFINSLFLSYPLSRVKA